MSGLYLNANDFQRYVNDYFEYGINYFVEEKIDVYWDEPDGKEE